jgi:hypothetical protein
MGVLRGRVVDGCKAQNLSRHIIINSGIVCALEEGHDGVTVALVHAKTAGDRTGKASEAGAATLMDDTKRNLITVPVQ